MHNAETEERAFRRELRRASIRRQRKRRKKIKQKLFGLFFIIAAVAIVWFAALDTSTEGWDITAALIFLPLGIGFLVSKDNLIG